MKIFHKKEVSSVVMKRVKIRNPDRGKYLSQSRNSKAGSLMNISLSGCLRGGEREHFILPTMEHV